MPDGCSLGPLLVMSLVIVNGIDIFAPTKSAVAVPFVLSSALSVPRPEDCLKSARIKLNCLSIQFSKVLNSLFGKGKPTSPPPSPHGCPPQGSRIPPPGPTLKSPGLPGRSSTCSQTNVALCESPSPKVTVTCSMWHWPVANPVGSV